MQNNILEILKENPLIPVVTIYDLNDIDKIFKEVGKELKKKIK